MFWVAMISGIFGGWVALFNFYLSLIRPPLRRHTHPTEQQRHVSGIPLVGSLLLMVAVIWAHPLWLWLVLMLLDTGGFHILAIALIGGAFRKSPP